MIVITLPNGEKKLFDHPVTVLSVAQHISPSLGKSALAGKVNERLVDTTFLINQDSTLVIVTEKNPESLDIIRHSCAHLLAQAVKMLYPSAQVTIGPVIENGFFYDFAFERAFTPDDLEKIEKQMKALAKKNLTVSRQEISRNEALLLFENLGEHYKTKIIQDIPEQEILSLYQQGDFIDLCRGPHVPSTGKLNAFKLTKISGAYWRGDANKPMLSRIYGTAWHTQEALDAYLHQLQEAEKRDHRKIAKHLDLFHIQDDAPGMIFWHPNGWIIYQVIEQYMRKIMQQNGYLEVRTPQIVNISLWEKSGHCDKFGDDMFSLKTEHAHYAIKPMNCPCHVQIFNQGIKSYRELPLRLSEFGSCHRHEASGALHGLMRTRNFTQDDAHIFCTEQQIASEVHQFIDLLLTVYAKFGFEQNISVKLSTRPEKRVGSDQTWDKAEKALADVLNEKHIDWIELPGEGAFYGPKIEFVLKDCIGRSWTTGSVQLDFSMPARLEAEYISETGTRETPVMLHRAIFGSLERFIAILLEHHAGNLPLWLAPVQVAILNITDNQCDYAKKIENLLNTNGFRVKSDLRNEKIGLKIRENTLKRVPYQLIVGEKEKTTQTVSVRTVTGENLGNMSLSAFLNVIQTIQGD